ncbi:hypothetical protein, partial [Piscinibacter defluvii]|uniref:hypothetical protein n=1 Tax=Piscinibacter defluvii TaxID=1796922 RepID=UPI00197C71AC
MAFTALLSAAVDSGAQQLHDISGVWTAVATTSEGGRVNRGELHIVQHGNRIEAVSTTGKSAWAGTLTGRKLVADWRAKENAG